MIERAWDSRSFLVSRQMWYINVAVAVIAAFVLVVGLATARGGAGLDRLQRSGEDGQKAVGTKQTVGAEAHKDSALVGAAREYTLTRLTPPRPVRPKVKPKAKPVGNPPVKPKVKPVVPKPKPKPKPKVKPKPAAPRFSVESTFVFDGNYGMAWVRVPGKVQVRQVSVGDEVEGYTVTEVGQGYVKVVREGFDYELKVPKPKASTAHVPAQVSRTSSRSIPRRPGRPLLPTSRRNSRVKRSR